MEQLVPSFVPPLASLLAAAATKKGSRLTEMEVNQLRDSAACIMVPRATYDKLQESREFRDIEPENAWADWHRLEAQLTGQGYLPKLVMCAVGNARVEADIRAILAELKSDFTIDPQQGRDARMANSFACCHVRADPSITPEDEARVLNHTNIVYILSDNFVASEARENCVEMLRIVRALLLRNDSVAVKCESSGVTHGTARWLELAGAVERDDEATSFAFFRAFVQYPISSEAGDFYTCGMHLLGLPDLIISTQLASAQPPAPLLVSSSPLVRALFPHALAYT